MESVTRIVTPMQQSENTVHSSHAASMSGQRRRLWVNIETAVEQHWVNSTCLFEVYSRHSDGLVLGQRRRRLTGIELAMGCEAGRTLNRCSRFSVLPFQHTGGYTCTLKLVSGYPIKI